MIISALVLSFPLLALCSKSFCLSTGIHKWVQDVPYDLFSFGCLIFASAYSSCLPLLGMGAKSTFLSPRFCVRSPKQYDTLYWKIGIISGFLAFYWLVVGRIETINVNDISQEAGDLESLPRLLDCLICTRECHFHCIVI